MNFLGHYVPQLAQLMIQYNKKHHLFNLKGIAVSFFFSFMHTFNFVIVNRFLFCL